jgi:2-polyprenyl-6-methoxyphenol hydroxylase-like FAD-dependent oxidoreductase
MDIPSSKTDVLIAGAGPTGLVLALWLARLGIVPRIIDKAADTAKTSRAIVVQARTLEFYRQAGWADDFIDQGLKFTAVNLWVRTRKAARVFFGDAGKDLSPYPYAIISPQDEHEHFLIERLKELGVGVERQSELKDFQDKGDHIRARIKLKSGEEETADFKYIAGCDGAHSTVRDILHTGFAGSTYAHVFYVADVEADGSVMDKELHVALDDADFIGAFPMKGMGRVRLIGTFRDDATHKGVKPGWDDVGKSIMERLSINIHKVNWFSSYRVHHRVTGHFRKGRAFLLGDAAHIHSPVGAQGMNTGIGDAINLAWKLAEVLQGRAPASILETYEFERMAFAKRLVETTDRAFKIVVSPRPIARFMRTRVVPILLPFLFNFQFMRRFMFRTVSQTGIHYRGSPLSVGQAGKLRGGDRLPWVDFGDGRNNFKPLQSMDWQVHIYGEANEALKAACEKHALPLHVFSYNDAVKKSGLRKDALYLIRPDGYIALIDETGGSAAFEEYMSAKFITGAIF